MSYIHHYDGHLRAGGEPHEAGVLAMEWVIGADGVLESYSGSLVGLEVPDLSSGRHPGNVTEIQFFLVDSPDPLVTPEVGSPVVLDNLDTPDSSPLG